MLVRAPYVAVFVLSLSCAAPKAADAPPAHPSHVVVVETKGLDPTRVEAWFERARTRLEPCLGSSGGKLRVRLSSVDGNVSVEIEPSGLLDSFQRRCALDALSATQDDTTRSPWTGATVAPSGFTSLVTMEW
jgi:hypothetical protein